MTVTPVADVAPVFTTADDANHDVAENTAATVVVASVAAEGGDDPTDPITYSLAAGTADNDLFSIDGMTGEITFVASPDFETPLDGGSDNIYDLTVTATDSSSATVDQTSR